MHLLRLPYLWRRTVAAALAGLVFGVALLSTAPNIHDRLHPDAHEADHRCAITLFAEGLTIPAAALVMAAVVWLIADLAARSNAKPNAIPAFRLPPVRGPPTD